VKILDSALQAHYESRHTTLAFGLKITRGDGQIFAFTSHDIDDVIGGVTYSAVNGLDVTSIQHASGLAVGNMEITALNDGSIFTTLDIKNRLWIGAIFELFHYNYNSLATPANLIITGSIGEVRPSDTTVTVELRDKRQVLQNTVTNTVTKECPARLGSANKWRGGLCMKDISAAPHTMSGTVSHLTSSRVFRDSARLEVADWFGDGEVRWLTGANAGVSVKVSEYAADGTFTLGIAMVYPIQIGDTFTAIAGCRKRFEEDCRDKFNNAVNFQGYPHLSGMDKALGGYQP
jgi:uncharacterized phage protein (TIGR02218 family)